MLGKTKHFAVGLSAHIAQRIFQLRLKLVVDFIKFKIVSDMKINLIIRRQNEVKPVCGWIGLYKTGCCFGNDKPRFQKT